MIESLEEWEKQETIKVLKQAEIPIHWIGYKFIVTAISIIIEEWENPFLTLSNVCVKVAKKHKTTASKVECAFRYVIDNTEISKALGYKIRLSPKKLLFTIAGNIKQQLRI